MSSENLTKDEIDFATVYGTLFSLSTTLEYLAAVRVLMRERKANHASNKAREAEISCQLVHNTLEREITKRMTAEERTVALAAVEHHKDTVYGYFVLDSDKQRRVKSLIDKLRREQLK